MPVSLVFDFYATGLLKHIFVGEGWKVCVRDGGGGNGVCVCAVCTCVDRYICASGCV